VDTEVHQEDIIVEFIDGVDTRVHQKDIIVKFIDGVDIEEFIIEQQDIMEEVETKDAWVMLAKKVHIIADSGKLLARCNGCGPGSYPDSVTVHANRGDAWAQWVVEARGNKCALRSDTGRYAARCNGCWRGGAYPDSVFNHAGTASLGQSWTVWDMKRFGHKVAFRADTGRYMARCNGCVPGGAYPDAAFVHARNPPSEPWALWTIEIAGAARSGGQHRRHRRRGHWRRSHHVVRRHFRRRCVVRGRHRYCFNMRNNKKK